MKIIFHVFFFYLILFSQTAHALAVPTNFAIFDATQTEQPAKKNTPPNPRNLRPNWWEYFEVKKEQLSERIQETKASLNNIITAVPQSQQEEAIKLVREIIANLEAYEKEKEKRFQIKERVFQEKYDLEKYIDLTTELRTIKRRQSDLISEIDAKSEEIDREEQKLNDLHAEYLTKGEMTQGRIISGLKILNLRSNLALLRENLRILRESLEVEKKNEQWLQKEITFAGSHMDYSSVSLAEIDKNLQAAQSNLENERNETAQFKKEYLKEIENKELSELRRDFLKQKFLLSLIKDHLAEITLIKFQMKKVIVQIGQNKSIPSLEALNQRMNKWNHDITISEDNIEDWSRRSREILTKSLSEFSSLDQKEDTAKQELYKNLIKESENTLIAIGSLETELFVAKSLQKLINHQIEKTYTSAFDWIKHYWKKIKQFFISHAQFYRKTIFKLGNTPITPLALFKFVLIVVITIVLGKIFSKWILRFAATHKQISRSGAYALARLAYYFLLIIGIIIAFVSIGFDFTAFAFIAGALTVGIGFGLQSIFNNFVSGIIILVEKNVRVGDVIELEEGKFGIVKEIKVRSTLITTFDGIDMLIPNSELVSKKFSNWTLREPVRRLRIPFGVSYSSDKEFVRKVVIEAAKKVFITIEDPGREPQVWLTGFGDFALNFELVVWVNETLLSTPTSSYSLYYWAMETALKENNIEIPYPKRVIHITEKESF